MIQLNYIKLSGFMGAVSVMMVLGGFDLQTAEAGSGSLVGKLLGHKVIVDSKGRETQIPVTEVVPGDIVEYTLVYQNQDKANPLAGIVIASPIPPDTAWVMDRVKAERPAHFEASIDGGEEYQTPPIWIKTIGPDGKEVAVEAPAEKYTNLRWTLVEPLPAGEQVSLKYRVKVK